MTLMKSPTALFAALVNSANSDLNLTADNFKYRKLMAYPGSEWPNAVISTDLGTKSVNGVTCERIVPELGWSEKADKCIFYWANTLGAGDFTIDLYADNKAWVYVDGVLVGSSVDLYTLYSATITLTATSEVVILLYNGTGVGYLTANIHNDTDNASTDDSWHCLKVNASTSAERFKDLSTLTYVEVDLSGDEVKEDYAPFIYNRIPLATLFKNVDNDSNTAGIQLPYHTDDASMLVGAVNNFKSIYNDWYRFSHKSGQGYPASSSELDDWSYDETYDLVQSTTNSSTYIGFISNDKVEDYTFNTVVTANSADDDYITLVLAAFKVDDIDTEEHTLELVFNRGGGGTNNSYVRVYHNFFNNPVVLNVLDPDTTTANTTQWTPWYGHGVVVREGSVLTIYAKMDTLENNGVSADRPAMIKSMVKDLARLSIADLEDLGYLKCTIDMAEVASEFGSLPVRVGYGQLSQAGAKWWNIQRPGDNPSVTPELSDFIESSYGLTFTDTGVSVNDTGNSAYDIVVDDLAYVGTLQMVPTTKRYMCSWQRLLDAGTYKRFLSGSMVDVDKSVWSITDNILSVNDPTLNMNLLVTPYSSTNYEFGVRITSDASGYGVYVVLGQAYDGTDYYTLVLVVDVPENAGGGELYLARFKNATPTVLGIYDKSGDTYNWDTVTYVDVLVKRVDNVFTFNVVRPEGDPGQDWSYAYDITDVTELAALIDGSSFGVGSINHTATTFQQLVVK